MKLSDMWWYKYNPVNFDALILNEDIKPTLLKALDEVPNLMLFGPPGVGKSAFAKILLSHTGYDNLWINASKDRGIDVVRELIVPFGRAMSLHPLKIIVINEADQLTPDAQKSLKEETEDVIDITRFIFITNEGHKITEPLHSRCWIVEVNKPPAKEVWERLNMILDNEKVEIEKELLKDVIKECYPDIRKMINSLQMSVSRGKIKKVVYNIGEELLSDILAGILRKDVEKVRKLLRSNTINYSELYKYLFDNVGEFKSPGNAVLAIGEAHRWDSFVSIREINFMYMVFKMISEGTV